MGTPRTAGEILQGFFVNLFTHHRSISNKISIKVDFVGEMFCGINFYVYFCIRIIIKIWKEIY